MLDPSTAVTIRRLADEAPDARVARVSGVLDTLTASTRAIGLRLEDGRLLRGFAGQVPLEQLKDLLGRSVVLEGHLLAPPIDFGSFFGQWPGDEDDGQLSTTLRELS